MTRYQLNPKALRDFYPTESVMDNHKRVLVLQREIPDGLLPGESHKVTFGKGDTVVVSADEGGTVTIARKG